MTEQQANLFKLFKEIDAVCKKNNIEYCLAGGSCIGPVRHHGFIPWDDDMDIFMTRDNWLKFVEASKRDFPEGRCLLAHELDHNYTNMFGRYCDTTSTAIHRHAIYQPEPSGEIIDIFMLDPVISSPDKFNEYVENVVLYSELVNKTAPLYGYRYNIKAGRYLRYWFLSKIIGRNRVLDMLQKKLCKYPEEECDAYAMRWGGCPFLFPKEWFKEVRTCYMEDGEYPIIYMNNAFLTWHYGDDWVYIPPCNERKSHDTVSRLDMGSDEFRRQYDVFVHSPRKRWFIELLGVYRKAYYMRKAAKRERIAMGILKDKAKLTALDLYKRLEDNNTNIETMIRERRFEELLDIFGPYMRFQLSSECIGSHDFADVLRMNSPCFVPIGDDVLHGFLLMLLYINKVGKADRLLEIRKLQPDYREEVFEDISRFISDFRYSVNCYDIGKYEEGYRVIDRLYSDFSDNTMLMKLVIRYAFYKEQGSKKRAAELILKGQELCPEDGEFLFYNIRFISGEKNPDRLKEAFDKVCTMTNNGMVLLEIKEYDYGSHSE
ncbi:MAG: phosphorylcholine transferase LicD [Butyrivibrio sp.]